MTTCPLIYDNSTTVSSFYYHFGFTLYLNGEEPWVVRDLLIHIICGLLCLFMCFRLCKDRVSVSGPKSGSFHLSEAPGFPTKVRPQNLKSTFSRDTFASLYCFESVWMRQLCTQGHRNFSHTYLQNCWSCVKLHREFEWTPIYKLQILNYLRAWLWHILCAWWGHDAVSALLNCNKIDYFHSLTGQFYCWYKITSALCSHMFCPYFSWMYLAIIRLN